MLSLFVNVVLGQYFRADLIIFIKLLFCVKALCLLSILSVVILFSLMSTLPLIDVAA